MTSTEQSPTFTQRLKRKLLNDPIIGELTIWQNLRLRIPPGWVVLDNKLYDTDPQADATSSSIINWDEGFVEDVLWIQECLATDHGKYEVPKSNHFNIDISWLPDNVDGKYCATLSWMAADEMIDIKKFESKDRLQIRERIEFWMMDIKSLNPSIGLDA